MRNLVMLLLLSNILGDLKSTVCLRFSNRCLHTSDSSQIRCSFNFVIRLRLVCQHKFVHNCKTIDIQRPMNVIMLGCLYTGTIYQYYKYNDT